MNANRVNTGKYALVFTPKTGLVSGGQGVAGDVGGPAVVYRAGQPLGERMRGEPARQT